MWSENGSKLMVGSLIVGAMGVQGSSGVEARLMLDIAADSLESIERVALWIACFAESMYTSQLSTSVEYST